METTVVNLRQRVYDVYIGRQTDGHDGYFGNPFVIGRDGNRRKVLKLYREYFLKRLRTDKKFAERVDELRGKRLGCFCAPEQCHGDIIADYANIDIKIKPYVEKLIQNGFYTFMSCEGGEGHLCRSRTIRIDVDRPTVGCSMSECGETKCFARFLDLCDFIESQGWRFCSVRLIQNYIMKTGGEKDTSVFFELVWN